MSRADDPYDNAWAESFWTGPPAAVIKAADFENDRKAQTCRPVVAIRFGKVFEQTKRRKA